MKKLKRIRYIVLRQGKECPKCKNQMQRRGHKEIDSKILSQPYYFTEWDYCTNCNYLQHYDEMKRYNKNDSGVYANFKAIEEEQLNFLSSI